MECFRYHAKLAQFSKWFDAGNDRHGDTHLTSFFEEGKELAIVVEQLCHGIVGTQVLFFLEVQDIHFKVRSLFVLFGVASNTVVEFLSGTFDRSVVGEESLVESVHLSDEIGSMFVSSLGRNEARVFFRFVTPEQ